MPESLPPRPTGRLTASKVSPASVVAPRTKKPKSVDPSKLSAGAEIVRLLTAAQVAVLVQWILLDWFVSPNVFRALTVMSYPPDVTLPKVKALVSPSTSSCSSLRRELICKVPPKRVMGPVPSPMYSEVPTAPVARLAKAAAPVWALRTAELTKVPAWIVVPAE